MEQIHVNVSEEGHLLVTYMGEANRFTEIEAGVYTNLREGRTHDVYGNFQTIVFGTDPHGKTMLMTAGRVPSNLRRPRQQGWPGGGNHVWVFHNCPDV